MKQSKVFWRKLVSILLAAAMICSTITPTVLFAAPKEEGQISYPYLALDEANKEAHSADEDEVAAKIEWYTRNFQLAAEIAEIGDIGTIGEVGEGIVAYAAEPLVRNIDDLPATLFSTDLSNENPYSGLYRQIVNADGVEREMGLYLPEGMRRNEYFVTIALPDGADVYDYIEESGWIDIAEENNVALRLLIPKDGVWGTYEEEMAYVNAARNGGGNSFFGFRYMTFGAEYFFGAGEGGAILQKWAAANPTNTISQVYIGVDVSDAELVGLTKDITFGDNMAMPAHPDSEVKPSFTDIPATEIPVPTWLIGSSGSARYWGFVNDVGEDYEEIGQNTLPTRVYIQDKGSSNAVATSYSDIESMLWVSGQMPYDNTALVRVAYGFLSHFTRGVNDSVHANVLLERLDYNEMKEDGRLFEVFDFVHTVDNSGTEGATTQTTDWKRNYIVYIPGQCMDYETVRYPVVYFFSGGSTPSHVYFDTTDAWEIADRYGFIAVVPSSVNGWNTQDGSWPETVDPVTGSVSDDIDFVDKLFTRIEEDFNVDPGRVYITGLSMGGILTNYLGMQLGDRITAVGGTSGPIFDAEVYDDTRTKGSGYRYLEGATTNILPAMYIFGERDNWPIYIGEWTDDNYADWYAGQMNTNNANRFNDVYYSYATQKYWVDRNGLDFDDYVFTETGLTYGGQTSNPVEYTPETQAKRHTTAMWFNEQGVPLVAWGACAGRAHSTAVCDYEKVWTDWFALFAKDADGTLYYSPSGFVEDDAVAVGAKPAVDKLQEFVRRLYREFLGREADPTGFAAWTNALATGAATMAELIRGFVLSREFIANPLTNEEFVTVMYKIVFNRKPDATGLAAWVEVLENGATRKKVLEGFLNSDELKALADKLGVLAGSYNSDELVDLYYAATAFVTRLYKLVLDRTAAQNEVETWIRALNSGDYTPAQIVRAFYNSVEFRNRSLAAGELIRSVYRAVLDREPDATGYANWISYYVKLGLDKVLEGFLKSPEFHSLCGLYGMVQ